MTSRSLTAVLWDYDGTLADTRQRNYNVVRKLIREAAARSPDEIPALGSPDIYDRVNRRYANWRDLYTREFGFTEEETDRLGALWTPYQLADDTPAPVFAGIGAVLEALTGLPHGIVSMNARPQIQRSVREAELAHHFRAIVGWEDVHIRRQKPEPDGLLACLEQLTGLGPERGGPGLAQGLVLYVGDHETDVRCAANANEELRRRGVGVRVVTVAASFTGHAEHREWSLPPDFAACHPREILEVARGL